MFSPMARGLFYRAISQSGNLMNPWADPAQKGIAKARALKLAELMNCSTSETSTKEIVECLRKAPADKIIGAIPEFLVKLPFKIKG